MSLAGKKILVAGATGEVGRGAALAFASAGADVFIAGRNEQKLNDVKASMMAKQGSTTVTVIATDYSTVAGAKKLQESVKQVTFDTVLVSSGPWWPITEMTKVEDLSVFGKALAANVEAHMLLYRILAPITKEQYITINGMAAEGLPSTGLTGILANAVQGFTKVAHDECAKRDSLPNFTQAMIQASVGHGQFRKNTTDPETFGSVFVAMAKGLHRTDESGSIIVDDALVESLQN